MCLHPCPQPDAQHDDRGEQVLEHHRWRERHHSDTGAGRQAYALAFGGPLEAISKAYRAWEWEATF